MPRHPDTSRWHLYDAALRAGRAHRSAGGERWWPELAPLSPRERDLVQRALQAEELEGQQAELPSEAAARETMAPGSDTPPDATTLSDPGDPT